MKINRNILWTETFVNKLVKLGVKYACISPGSRNTPLTIAFANNEQIKSYVLIDERSSAFFALGLAQASLSAVALVCTSGTAAAEFYPAIIEAYQQRIPLIVCTADRPPELLGRGANQTIFQDNIYRNHIRWFVNAGIPEVTKERLEFLCRIAEKAVTESTKTNRGPVHINFPFSKPFEPGSFTDEVDDSVLDSGNELKNLIYKSSDEPLLHTQVNVREKLFSEIFNSVVNNTKGFIVAGPGSNTERFALKCHELSELLSYPVFADGASQLRFGSHPKDNILVNFEGYVRSPEFMETSSPEVIIQFGKILTSKGMENFMAATEADYYVVDEFGDWHDPMKKAKAVVQMNPGDFCETIIKMLKAQNFSRMDKGWISGFIKSECKAETIKGELINNAAFPFEGRIITEVIDLMPDSSALMISNSMPVRDLDYFAQKSAKAIKVYHNRGASGIDGITSTALGIAEASDVPAVLITGDLAFYYDMNGLLASYKYSIPLIVILINNNGGGIFEMLPISKYEKVFNEYFITPHNLDFSLFVKGYGGSFEVIKDWDNLHEAFNSALKRRDLSVLQINTDAKQSAEYRKDYWKKVQQNI